MEAYRVQGPRQTLFVRIRVSGKQHEKYNKLIDVRTIIVIRPAERWRCS